MIGQRVSGHRQKYSNVSNGRNGQDEHSLSQHISITYTGSERPPRSHHRYSTRVFSQTAHSFQCKWLTMQLPHTRTEPSILHWPMDGLRSFDRANVFAWTPVESKDQMEQPYKSATCPHHFSHSSKSVCFRNHLFSSLSTLYSVHQPQ